MERYVTGKLGEHYVVEQHPERDLPMASLPDARVDVCLYLIEPNQLPEVDIDAIVEIGKLVPIMPLLAKLKP